MTDPSIRLPRMKEWLLHGYFDSTRSNNGRSYIYIKVNDSTSDNERFLCVPK